MPHHLLVRDSGNIYPIYPLFSYSDLLSQMWGGGGHNVFLAFYAISNISREKIILGIKKY